MNNLPQSVLSNSLDNRSDLDPGYAAIFNDSHTEYNGASDYEFARFVPEGESCIYWFGEDAVLDGFLIVMPLCIGQATETPRWSTESNGVRNYIHLVTTTTVAILQFSFDEASKTASLVAAATDVGGLTLSDGVSAIQAAVPEPSTFGNIFAVSALFYVVSRRRFVVRDSRCS